MARAINIEDLLNKQKIESNRGSSRRGRVRYVSIEMDNRIRNKTFIVYEQEHHNHRQGLR